MAGAAASGGFLVSHLLPTLIRCRERCEPFRPERPPAQGPTSALEATHGQMDGFFGQFPYKCHLEEVASVGD